MLPATLNGCFSDAVSSFPRTLRTPFQTEDLLLNIFICGVLINRFISSLSCLMCYLWCFLQYEKHQREGQKQPVWFLSSKTCWLQFLQLFLHTKEFYFHVFESQGEKNIFLICGCPQRSLSPISSSWQIKKVSEVDWPKAEHANKTTPNSGRDGQLHTDIVQTQSIHTLFQIEPRVFQGL